MVDPKKASVDRASEGVAAELLVVWQTLIKAMGPFGEALGLGGKPSFDVTEIRMSRIEISEGEKLLAPVRFEDLRPGTSLFLDMRVDLEGKEVTVLSQIYIDEELAAQIMSTEIPEFEILPEDVTDDVLSDEILEKIRDVMKGFPLYTTAFLAILIKTRSRARNEEREKKG